MDAADRLCDALQAGRRFSVIRSIVEAHPEAITTRVSIELDDEGLGYEVLPFHYACYDRSSLRVIQYLYRKFTESLTMGDEYGALPLHYACLGSKPIDLRAVRFLVEECPETVMAADCDGCLPIYYACEHVGEDSIETVKFFVESNGECIKREDNNSQLPLHTACQNGASFKVVQLLMRKCPQGLQMTDKWGCLPLHTACKSGDASLEVARLLVEGFPEGVSHRDDDDNLPVHLACNNGSDQTDLVQLLIDAFPEALVDEWTGDHLLHRCCYIDSVHPNIVRYFIQQYPEAVKMRNCTEDLPLHICANNSSPNLEKLTALIEADPWALVAENVNGTPPLELHLDAINEAFNDLCRYTTVEEYMGLQDDVEDQAHDAQLIMKDALRGCIQEMRQTFVEATLRFNLPDSVVNHVFAFAVFHLHPETMDTD